MTVPLVLTIRCNYKEIKHLLEIQFSFLKVCANVKKFKLRLYWDYWVYDAGSVYLLERTSITYGRNEMVLSKL